MADIAQYSCINLQLPSFLKEDDPAWDKAVQLPLVDVVSGDKPALQTSFCMLRDDKQGAFFVRFVAQDDQIQAYFRLHDEPIYQEDVFELFIAEGGNLKSYKELEVSPYDVHFDGEILYNGPGNIVLNTGWELQGFLTKTRFDPLAKRTVSVWKMPYASFSMPPAPSKAWRFNAFRIDHKGDTISLSAWQKTGKANFHVPECFGELIFPA